MKKQSLTPNLFLNLLLTICCIQMVNAQSYQSIFGDSITQFNIFVPQMGMKTTFDCLDPELGEGYTTYISFRKENNSIINGKTYYRSDITSYIFLLTYYYMREDTSTGKIYTYHPKVSDEEYLVCDLSLNVGDTFYMHLYLGYSGIGHTKGYMIADSVTYLNGKKVIYFGNIYLSDGVLWVSSIEPHKFFFQEGIGSIFPFGYIQGTGDIDFSLLLCLHQDEDLVYIRNPESLYQCDYDCMLGSIDEHRKNKLHVYPNPIYTEFYVQSDEIVLDEAFIYTVYGQCVTHIKLHQELQKINIADLQKGVYFLKVTDIHGNIYSTKIIKI